MARRYLGDLYMVQLALLDDTGFAAGQQGTVWAAGETTAALVIAGGKSLELDENEGNQVPIEERGQQVGSWRFGGVDLNEARMVVSDFDESLITMIGATAISAFNSYFDFSTREGSHAQRPALCAILTQRAQGADGSDGTYFYHHRLINRLQAYVLATGGAPFQNKSEATLVLVPSKTTITPFGSTVNALGLGVQGNRINTLEFRSSNPIHLVSFMKDGVEDTFTTTYLPQASDTDSDASGNMMTDDGVATDPSTVATATGIVTLSAAGNSGEKIVFLHEHEEVLVS